MTARYFLVAAVRAAGCTSWGVDMQQLCIDQTPGRALPTQLPESPVRQRQLFQDSIGEEVGVDLWDLGG